MKNTNKLASKIKWQITRFAHRLTEGCTKSKQRLVREIIYGIQASKDVKLSNISRALHEPIKLIKTENRLSRNLASEDLTGILNRRISWLGSGQIGDDTVLSVDLSDLTKTYAKKMECLTKVRDGSTGALTKGYWLCEVIGADVQGERIVPMYGELYSHEADDFVSENAQILKAIDTVAGATEWRGIFAIDRGGDRYRLLKALLYRGLRFVVRQRGDRHVILPGGKTAVEYTVAVEREGYKEEKRLRLGYLPVS